MKKILFAIIIILVGCAKESSILPACDFVEASLQENEGEYRMSIKIHSESNEVTYCRDFGRCFTIQKHYFDCVTISVNYGEVITFTDIVACTVIAR